jgi:hypothetical protein
VHEPSVAAADVSSADVVRVRKGESAGGPYSATISWKDGRTSQGNHTAVLPDMPARGFIMKFQVRRRSPVHLRWHHKGACIACACGDVSRYVHVGSSSEVRRPVRPGMMPV